MTINLRVPGPTPVPDHVAQAGAQPMVNHRGPQFASTFRDVVEGLKPFFGTQGDPLILTGSGTAAQEAAVVNLLSPGDEVLSVTCGVFGNRFADIAAAFGAHVHRLEVPWGQAATVSAVAEALATHPRVGAVILTHNETSTGVVNDVRSLVARVRADVPDAVVMVDGVSSIGAVPFNLDEWDVDVAITGSQKAFMTPPGLAMVAVGPRGWEAYRRASMPRFYWDFEKAQKNGIKGTTPFTPAVGTIHGLAAALRTMLAEGPAAIYERHRRIGRLVREGVASLGLELFADPAVASDTVTAVRVPDGMDAAALLRVLREEYGVVLGGGQDWLKGQIVRIGHMGAVTDFEIEEVMAAMRRRCRERWNAPPPDRR